MGAETSALPVALGLALLVSAVFLVSCDDRPLPRFARPGDADGGVDADDDAGFDGNPGPIGISEGGEY